MFGFSIPSLADVLWSVATSTLVLAGLLLAAVALRLLHWIERLPFAGVLATRLAPYLVFAGPLSVVAAAALLFLAGFRLADERTEARELRRDLAWSRAQIDNMQAAADDAERLERKAAGELSKLRDQVDAYLSAPERNRVCRFNEFDVRRLQPLR